MCVKEKESALVSDFARKNGLGKKENLSESDVESFFRFEWIMACNCTCPDLGFDIVIQDILQYTGNSSTDEDVAPAGN